MHRILPLAPTTFLYIRFDRNSDKSKHNNSIRYKELPESMKPKTLSDNFTPFPLPKYDETLGYGPVRLNNIPDIEIAKSRQYQREVKVMEATMEINENQKEESNDSLLDIQSQDIGDALNSSSTTSSSSPLHKIQNDNISTILSEKNALSGYSISSDYPLIDRIYCERSIDDLLTQFIERPQTEARCATLSDLASTISKRNDEEIIRMFSKISSPFTPDGRGLNFIITKVYKFGRPYSVTSSLVNAYANLVEAASVFFVQEQPWRLSQNPSLVINILNFMALIKVFEPNKWFTFSNLSPSNRADYRHPRGTNRTTSFWGTGEELFDFIMELVLLNENSNCSSLLNLCNNEQLVDLLNGFSAVMPDGRAIGSVFNCIMKEFLQRLKSNYGNKMTKEEFKTIERMYLSTVLVDATNIELQTILLSKDIKILRGADFFAAISRSKESLVKERALNLLQESIDNALEISDISTLLALLESGSELLLSMSNKEAAYDFALKNKFDYNILHSFQYFKAVADKLNEEQSLISSKIPNSLSDIQAQLVNLNNSKSLNSKNKNILLSSSSSSLLLSPTSSSTKTNYIVSNSKLRRFSRPLMTMLSQLEYLNSMDSIFILHSSLVMKSTDQLISAVRKLPSGKDTLIITMSCLRELSIKSLTSPNIEEQKAATQSLEIIAYELEKGRAVLLPFSEEILLHDAGAYCDEDLMLWTIAAFFARELPLVKVHTLIHSDSTTRAPYRFLKGPHSLLVSSQSLYHKKSPLLSAIYSKELMIVTHNAKLRKPIRDRKCTLHVYNPIRARFIYRRDKALFDKYHVTARNLIPGFSCGAMEHDWRGLGVYTPDHAQVSYKPISAITGGKTLNETHDN